MKVAWIGVIGTIIGALIGVFGAPQYKKFIDGPPEGIFSVDLNYIHKSQIPEKLQNQITNYPCSLKIVHIDGPPVEDVTVSIISGHKLKNLINIKRNDENAIAKIIGRTLKVEIPTLRKNSIIDLEFFSVGNPSFKKNVIFSKGRLLGEVPAKTKKSWYKSDNVIIPTFLAVFGVGLILLFYILRRYVEPYFLEISPDNFKVYGTIAVAFAILPFNFNISLIFIIYALIKIYQEILEIKQAITSDAD